MGGFQKFFKGLSAFPKKHKKFVTTDSFRFPQGFKIDEGRRQIYRFISEVRGTRP